MTTGQFVFTAAIVLVIVGVLCVDPKVDNTGGDGFSRGGKRDPFRNLLMRPDGSLRRATKPVLVAMLAVLLVVVWIAQPAS